MKEPSICMWFNKMIFITGDSHGEMSIGKISKSNWPEGSSLTKDDTLIITGDFGLLWNNPPSKAELYWLDWLEKKPFNILFIDGNHENFALLNDLPIVGLYGGKAGKVRDNIYHLRRAEVYIIEEKKFLCFGGAASVDKGQRIAYKSWWPEEIPSMQEDNKLIDACIDHNWTFDYIITHTAPKHIIMKYMLSNMSVHCHVSDILSEILWYNGYSNPMTLKFKKWYFGHFHQDKKLGDKFHLLYDSIIKIDD